MRGVGFLEVRMLWAESDTMFKKVRLHIKSNVIYKSHGLNSALCVSKLIVLKTC